MRLSAQRTEQAEGMGRRRAWRAQARIFPERR